MNIKDIETKMQELEKQVAVLQDLENIKRLQRSYGYYLEHWMYREVIDCFSSRPDTELNIMAGIYLGKKVIRRFFTGEKGRSTDPEMLHQIMQLSGVVDIEADGLTARGRWYGFGAMALPADTGIMQAYTFGVYTVEYVKEEGCWKIHKITWNPSLNVSPGRGWVKPERVADIPMEKLPEPPRPDKPRHVDSRYPSGYIPPFHYPHPVTGKKTSEGRHNASLRARWDKIS